MMDQASSSVPAGRSSKKKIIVGAVIVILLVVLGIVFRGSIFGGPVAGSPEFARAEMLGLVEKVGKLMKLPTDEEPTIITVNDPAQLTSQAFFVNAKQGDKVLLYANARKAVLFNPTEGVIIEVAPITFGESIPQGRR